MQKTDVKNYLEKTFKKVRVTDEGLRFNVQELNHSQLSMISNIPYNVKPKIKRSGTGLVVIIKV